jgi:hypothetical protein
MAQSRSVSLDEQVLAKLMLLEYFRPESFRRLAQLQSEQQGRPAELAKLELRAKPAPPPEPKSTTNISDDGTGSSGGTRLAWFDRTGKETGSVGPTGDYRALALSPPGARVATSRMDAENLDIWLFDLGHNTNTRLTSDPLSDTAPVWSRDGSRVGWAYDGREADFLFIGSAQPILLPISYLRTDDSQGFESFRLI